MMMNHEPEFIKLYISILNERYSNGPITALLACLQYTNSLTQNENCMQFSTVIFFQMYMCIATNLHVITTSCNSHAIQW